MLYLLHDAFCVLFPVSKQNKVMISGMQGVWTKGFNSITLKTKKKSTVLIATSLLLFLSTKRYVQESLDDVQPVMSMVQSVLSNTADWKKQKQPQTNKKHISTKQTNKQTNGQTVKQILS